MNEIQTTLVTSCVLHKDKNESLYQYFDEISPTYSFLVRRTIHHLKHDLNGETLTNYRTRLKQENNLTNRFAKAVVTSAKNILKLSTAAGEYLHSTYDLKLRKLTKKIIKTKASLNKPNISKIRKRNLKTKLFWLEMRKNRTMQLQNNGPKPLLTFGTKKLLKSNKERFLQKRDNQIFYIGDKNEHLGNQQVKLFYDKKYNKFTYLIRLENQWIKDSKYIAGEFIIRDNKAKREILKTLKHPKSNPLSFRIIRKEQMLFLQIMYQINSNRITRNDHGVLGVDFNKDFVTVSDIDENGTLLSNGCIRYIHKGTSGVTNNSMRHLVIDLVNTALTTGKDIVIEDLKSLNKRKQEKIERKHYNRMINTLKFSKFRKLLQTRCDKCGVTLSLINPYNTSKIASNKYCYNMKLTIHSAASYVIARRFYGLD